MINVKFTHRLPIADTAGIKLKEYCSKKHVCLEDYSRFVDVRDGEGNPLARFPATNRRDPVSPIMPFPVTTTCSRSNEPQINAEPMCPSLLHEAASGSSFIPEENSLATVIIQRCQRANLLRGCLSLFIARAAPCHYA